MGMYNLTIRLSEEERDWLDQQAKKEQRSMGNLIRYILHCYRQTHLSSEEIAHK